MTDWRDDPRLVLLTSAQVQHLDSLVGDPNLKLWCGIYAQRNAEWLGQDK